MRLGPLRLPNGILARIFASLAIALMISTLLTDFSYRLVDRIVFPTTGDEDLGFCSEEAVEMLQTRGRAFLTLLEGEDGDPATLSDSERETVETLVGGGEFLLLVDEQGRVGDQVIGHCSVEPQQTWNYEPKECQRLTGFTGPEEIWRAVSIPVEGSDQFFVLGDLAIYEGAHAGLIPNLPSWSDVQALWAGTASVDQRISLMLRLSQWLSLLSSLLLVVIVGSILSFAIVRPIRRLSQQASVPLGEDGLVRAEFASGGRAVEFQQLDTQLNILRTRVNSLVTELDQMDRQRRSWIAQVAHDLRTPLTALSACLERAEARAHVTDEGPSRDEAIRSMLEIARLDLDRVHRMADDLFEIARLEHRPDLSIEEVLPAELTRRTVRALQPLADRRGLVVMTEISESVQAIQADGGRVARALENLLINAIRYGRKRIRVKVFNAGDQVTFRVEDDGGGFPAPSGIVDLENLPRKSAHDDSAGLGLLVADRVAEAHGGKLGAENFEDAGSAVWLMLPQVARAG